MGLQQEDYTEVFEDSTSCIERSNRVPSMTLGGRERAVHIDTRKTHEAVQNGHIGLSQISTKHPLCRKLGEPRPQLDIDLNPSRPGDRWQEASRLVDGSGPVRICR